MQRDSMDDALRNGLWNTYKMAWPKPSVYVGEDEYYDGFFTSLWFHFLKEPIDNIPASIPRAEDVLKSWFFHASWNKVYDFVEYLLEYNARCEHDEYGLGLGEMANHVLEREQSAYRAVGTQLVEITDEDELAAIEQALGDQGSTLFAPARDHLARASGLVFDRKAPDYRNSIKESIFAVESAASIATGLKKPDLDKALAALRQQHGFHPAMEKAFNSLYGYTSDKDGIRHAMMEESDCDFHDAKYMLVACAAFVNYLVGKMAN